MKYLLTTILTVFCGMESMSGAVTTSTTCGVGGTQSVSNPTNCSINPANSAPSAAASITINQLTFVPSAGSFTSFTVDVSGSATAIPFYNPGTGPNIGSSASSTANVSYQFSTPGPVRQGVITLSYSVNNLQSGPGNDSGQIAVQVGSLGDSCGGIGGICNGFLDTPGPRSFSFTLGNTFGFDLTEAFKAVGDPSSEGTGFAKGGLTFNLQLFEADGKTPVAISAAPEPGTLGLLLAPLGGIGVRWVLRRNRRL